MSVSSAKPRLRDLGITLGQMAPGSLNAITDVAGVKVGYTTVITDTPRVVRSGVTAIWPSDSIYTDHLFAGYHSFNGNGEMTGTIWLQEQGTLAGPIGITNTHAVGVVRDAICRLAAERFVQNPWHLPVTGETWDGWLSDAETFPITTDHALAAFKTAQGGAIAEGNVGGGTGMICHEFKGGTGTASRKLSEAQGGWTVGALVQANYGMREMLRCGHAPVGLEITADIVPSSRDEPKDQGSIIVILATDAPLLPIQCQRLARRATTGLAWAGGFGANSSGDIFLAFSTGNVVQAGARMTDIRMLGLDQCTPLFQAAAEATEEAIWNAMIAAETMTGFKGRTVHAIPHDLLRQAVARYRRQD
ncbi:P1 family peptidase [Dongia soli]|uniref:P1 family peptidase n=1 Tax=Dongia soli TaxID=600628 RepID=A0ABU5EBV3_9PROT|nr:P1 family peptidase [Dongia soli]MDY0883485.1 P1 family peptidase [Dongia soli]